MYKLILILNIANDEKIYLINSFSQKIINCINLKFMKRVTLTINLEDFKKIIDQN